MKFFKAFSFFCELISRKTFHPISERSRLSSRRRSWVQSLNKRDRDSTHELPRNWNETSSEQSSDCIRCKYFENTQLQLGLRISRALQKFTFASKQRERAKKVPLQFGKFVEHFNNRINEQKKGELLLLQQTRVRRGKFLVETFFFCLEQIWTLQLVHQ